MYSRTMTNEAEALAQAESAKPVYVVRSKVSIKSTVNHFITMTISVLVRALVLWAIALFFWPTIISSYLVALAIVVSYHALVGPPVEFRYWTDNILNEQSSKKPEKWA